MRVLTAVEGGCGAGADRVGVEGRRALTLAPPALGARSLPRPAPPTRRCPGSPPWLLSSLCLVFLCCCCCCPSLRCWHAMACHGSCWPLRPTLASSAAELWRAAYSRPGILQMPKRGLWKRFPPSSGFVRRPESLQYSLCLTYC